MDYQKILNEIREELLPFENQGKVASYIPQLACVDPDKFGIHLHCTNGGVYSIGDHQERFSIQSISKVFTLALALDTVGEDLWKRMEVEPSGNPFNSLVQLEHEEGIPRNPFINAGALVVADILLSHFEDPEAKLLSFVREITGNDTINIDKKVAASEMEHKHRNASLANLMKDFGNLENDINEVLKFYFNHCAIAMSCEELAKAFRIFLNSGKYDLNQKDRAVSSVTAKRINALMLTCGFYDESGEFAFRVGIPGKSGVGGGIVAVHPEYYSVAVWSPPLNEKGNSELAMEVLERLTTKTGISVF